MLSTRRIDRRLADRADPTSGTSQVPRGVSTTRVTGICRELATLTRVYGFNNARLHSALGYRTTAEAEPDYHGQNTPAQRPLRGQPA